MSVVNEWGDMPGAMIGEIVLYTRSDGKQYPAICIKDEREKFEDEIGLFVFGALGSPARGAHSSYSFTPKPNTWRFRDALPRHRDPNVPTLGQIMLQGYRNEGRTVAWGKDLGPERMKAMEGGEIFTLLDKDGKPYAELLRDSYGTIREKRLASSL